MRERLETLIELLVELLDCLDGDSDFEADPAEDGIADFEALVEQLGSHGTRATLL